MDPLITVDDLDARGVSITDAARAEAVATDVSASIRAYTGQTITRVTDDEARLRVRSRVLRLPQRPVAAVSSVANTSGHELAFAWDAGDTVTFGADSALYAFEVEPFRTREFWVDVVYTHGYETIPDDIIAVACALAAKALAQEPGGAGVTQETAGPFSRSFASPMGLGAPERSILDRYRRPLGLIRVGP